MRVHRFGQGNGKRTAPKRAVWLCLVGTIFVVVLLAFSVVRVARAQTTPLPADLPTQNGQDPPAQDSSNPDQPGTEPSVPATAVPSPPSFSSSQAAKAKTALASEASASDPATVAAASSPAASAAPAAMPPPAGPQDEQQKAIYESSANLLKLANVLKAEVDKTTADQLSVSVVRKAGEIEQLAHKMRSQ